MHVAGVILAPLFAFAHLPNFWTENFWIALGQRIHGSTRHPLCLLARKMWKFVGFHHWT